MKDPFYSKCPLCPDYYETAETAFQAKEKLEQHEKLKHNGKMVGIFGKIFPPKVVITRNT